MERIYKVFIKGLMAILPISITLQLISWLAGFAEDTFAQPLAALLPPHTYIPGMGILLGLVCILFIGLLINNYLTSHLFVWIEQQIKKIPLLKLIYNPIRDLMNLFDGDRGLGSQRVVMVQLYDGVEIVGLVTRDKFNDIQFGNTNKSASDLLAVYIPFSYALGGYTVIVPKNKVRETNLSPNQALQLAVTGWIKTKDL